MGQAAEDLGAARHGAIPMQVNGVAVDAATVMTLQHASDSRSKNEFLASLDIVSTIPTAHGQWLLYIEGNITPHQQGVFALYPEANKEAGTAVDAGGNGRLQVSSLHYLWFLDDDALATGLINPAGPLDNSVIANNETSQFLAVTLVYFHEPEQRQLDFTFLLSSSRGLGDNPDKSYAELVDVSAHGKGVFAVAEMIWKQGLQNSVRGGLWVQTADNPYLDGTGRTGNNYGAYLSTDHRLAEYGVNLRLGLANPRVSLAAKFIGIALDRAVGMNHAGIGYTDTFVSDQAGVGTGNRSQFEAYYRYGFAENFAITPSYQRIQHSAVDQRVDHNVNIISIRSSIRI